MTHCTHTHILKADQPFPLAAGIAHTKLNGIEHPCCGDHPGCELAVVARARFVSVDDLVGQVDIAELLNVRPNAVDNWRQRSTGFPEPLLTINARNAVFSKAEVQAWAQKTGRA